MQNRWLRAVVCATLACVGAANADVAAIKERPVIDGKLDEACWRTAKWHADFQPLAINDYQLANRTEFAVTTDGERLFLGVKCEAKDFAKLCARTNVSIWAANTIEFFFSPAADPLRYYHFAIAAPEGLTYAEYAEEGGLIHPDPYAPKWRSAITLGDRAWYGEIEIPLAAFYNTRAEDWRSEWTMNVARMDWSSPIRLHEFASWSALEKTFGEPSNFRRYAGFPRRTRSTDGAIEKAVATIRRETNGTLAGDLAVTVYVGEGGTYRFASSATETRTVELAAGRTTFAVPCAFTGNRRHDVSLALTRVADGRRFERSYPVSVDFDALRVTFAAPAYRTDFYPGQDCSRIAGTVMSAGNEPISLVLEGPGIPRTEQTAQSGATFAFDTPGFQPGTATLTLTCGAQKRVKKIRRLAKSPHRMTWVENGNLIVDGKPTFRRCFYGETYRCSKAYLARIAADDFALTPEAQYLGLEPARLIKGSEQREGVRDQPPSDAMKAAIDKAMDALKDRDFGGYYLCDEPECRGVSPIYLKHCYEYIIERDPFHVVYIASRDPVRYLDCCDVVEAHPYLGPFVGRDGQRKYGVPLAHYGDSIAAGVAVGRADKVIGDIPFAFAYRERDAACDYATFDEYVASVWAVLAEGAKTLYPFIKSAIDDRPGLYAGVKYANQSVRALENFLLVGERCRVRKDERHVVTRWRLTDGRTLFAVVHFGEGTYRTRFTADGDAFYEFRGSRVFRPLWGTRDLQLDLGPFETVILTSEPIDTGLPTADEIRYAAREEEYRRFNRDNQIVGREAELKFTVNGRTDIPVQLVDGVTDQVAYTCADANQSLEIAFPRKPIRFREIRLYGDALSKVVVSGCVGGTWRALEPTARQLGGETLTLTFAEPIIAEKVRIALNVWRASLYEVEFPYLKKE